MTTINQFAIGSHLKVARFGYSHHGIYIGNGQVIHYAGFCEAFRSGPIEIATLATFQGRAKTIEVIEYNHQYFSSNEIVARAKSRLAENSYNLIFNNCEHFACWCVTGKSISQQVKKVVHWVSMLTLSLAITPKLKRSW